MELPAITIPEFIINALPLDSVPVLLHPPLVHFAIVIPIVIVLLELVNIIQKRNATPEDPKGRAVSTVSFFLIIIMAVIFAAAYVSGSVDGKNTWDLLSEAGQSELKEHKLIGTYLVYASIILLIFKIIAFMGKKGRILFLLLAIVFAVATLKQGKDGGELVYEHGANVAKVKALDDKVFDLEDELDSLKSEGSVKKEEPKVEEAKSEAVAPDSTAKSEEPKAEAEETPKAEETAESTPAAPAEEKAEAPADEPVAEAPKAEEAAESTPAAEVPAEGDPQAKAEVEETESKDAFEAKEKAEAFVKDAEASVAEETAVPAAH